MKVLFRKKLVPAAGFLPGKPSPEYRKSGSRMMRFPVGLDESRR